MGITIEPVSPLINKNGHNAPSSVSTEAISGDPTMAYVPIISPLFLRAQAESFEKIIGGDVDSLHTAYSDGRITLQDASGRKQDVNVDKVYEAWSDTASVYANWNWDWAYSNWIRGSLETQETGKILIASYSRDGYYQHTNSKDLDLTTTIFGHKVEIFKVSEGQLEGVRFSTNRLSYIDGIGSTEQAAMGDLLQRIASYCQTKVESELEEKSFSCGLSSEPVYPTIDSHKRTLFTTLTMIDGYKIQTRHDLGDGNWYAYFSGDFCAATFLPVLPAQPVQFLDALKDIIKGEETDSIAQDV